MLLTYPAMYYGYPAVKKGQVSLQMASFLLITFRLLKLFYFRLSKTGVKKFTVICRQQKVMEIMH